MVVFPTEGRDTESSPAPGLQGDVLRQVVRITVSGDELRLRFSNEFGDSPLTLDSVHIALRKSEGTILPESDRSIQFNGKPSVRIPGGTFIYSDLLRLTVQPLSDLAVTLKASEVLKDITGHPGSRATSYIAMSDNAPAESLTNPVMTDHWYLLDGVVVRGKNATTAVVTLGDSITDGRGSLPNGNTRWPDYLARRLAENKRFAKIGVLNQGIGGNRIRRDGIGPSALSRFDRDVLGQAGVRWVIVFEGVNDIGGTSETNPSQQTTVVDDLIQAYQQFIGRANTHNLLAYCATITPFGRSLYFTSSTEASRQMITSGSEPVINAMECSTSTKLQEALPRPPTLMQRSIVVITCI